MATDLTIEQRLAAVEQAVTDLRRRLDAPEPATNWLERLTGTFENEPAFDEVLELGRAIRHADRPADASS